MKHFIVTAAMMMALSGCNTEAVSGGQTDVSTAQTLIEKPVVHIEIRSDFDIGLHSPPYVITASIDDANLMMVGSLHANTPSSDTYKTVRYLIASNAIDMIILEGTPASVDIDSAYATLGECLREASLCRTEMHYAYSLGKSMHADIRFSGGEAAPLDTYGYIVTQKGYSLEDYIAFWYVRNAVSLNGENGMNEDVLRQQDAQTKRYLDQQLGVIAKFDYDDWLAWYRNRMNVATVDLDAFDQAMLRPSVEEHSTIIERLSYEFNVVRDNHLMVTINDKINAGFRNILVVYGEGHVRKIYKALTDRSTSTPYLSKWF